MGQFDELFDGIAERLAEKVERKVLSAIGCDIAQLHADQLEICFTEEQAAPLLGVSVETLAKIRKTGGIGHTYSIPPTAFNNEGRPSNGRPVYMRHHLLSYLRRHEVLPATVSQADVAFENVYYFNPKSKVA